MSRAGFTYSHKSHVTGASGLYSRVRLEFPNRGRLYKRVCPSIRPLVHCSVRHCVHHTFFFENRKLTNLTKLTNLQIWQIWQIFFKTHLCSNELVLLEPQKLRRNGTECCRAIKPPTNTSANHLQLNPRTDSTQTNNVDQQQTNNEKETWKIVTHQSLYL